MRELTATEVASNKFDPEVLAKLQASIDALIEANRTEDPRMPQHLEMTHRILKAYPETCHLLTEEEIHEHFMGLQKQTGVVLIEKAAKKAAKGGKSASKAEKEQNLLRQLGLAPTKGKTDLLGGLMGD